jgi:hypothetical protein
MPDFDYQSSVSIPSPKDLLDTPQPLSELVSHACSVFCQRRNERGESRRFENPFSSEAFSSITSV